MNIVPSFIWGLLFLLPGLIGNSWFRFRVLSRELTVAPPPTTSIETLGYLTFIAFLAYSILLIVSWLNGLLYPILQFHIGFDPDVEHALKAILGAGPAQTSTRLTGPFFLISFAGALAVGLAEMASRNRLIQGAYRRHAYGWLASIIDKSTVENIQSKSHVTVVSVFVLTNLNEGGSFLGYQGTLKHIEIGTNKEILNLHLSDCGRFLVTIGKLGLSKRPVNRQSISEMHFVGSEIKNTAFNIHRFALDTSVSLPMN